jgi:hypothetical protein
MDDVRTHPFWQRDDKEGYIRETQKLMRQPDGSAITRPVASRWYNLNNVFMQTSGDIWVPSRDVLELADASSGDMRLSDHAARSMI